MVESLKKLDHFWLKCLKKISRFNAVLCVVCPSGFQEGVYAHACASHRRGVVSWLLSAETLFSSVHHLTHPHYWLNSSHGPLKKDSTRIRISEVLPRYNTCSNTTYVSTLVVQRSREEGILLWKPRIWEKKKTSSHILLSQCQVKKSR